jgi:hypothetical protein
MTDKVPLTSFILQQNVESAVEHTLPLHSMGFVRVEQIAFKDHAPHLTTAKVPQALAALKGFPRLERLSTIPFEDPPQRRHRLPPGELSTVYMPSINRSNPIHFQLSSHLTPDHLSLPDMSDYSNYIKEIKANGRLRILNQTLSAADYKWRSPRQSSPSLPRRKTTPALGPSRAPSRGSPRIHPRREVLRVASENTATPHDVRRTMAVQVEFVITRRGFYGIDQWIGRMR